MRGRMTRLEWIEGGKDTLCNGRTVYILERQVMCL